MANDSEYQAAFARVAAGKGTPRDYELTEKAAKNAGSWGGKARAALQQSAKNSK